MNRAWLLLLALALPGTADGVLAQAALQPHIAAYRVGLDRRPGKAGALIEARGGLVIEWRRECDGWVSRQRLGFVATTDDGATINHDVRFTSWEAMDGSRLRYVVRSFEDDRLQDEYRGIAELQQGDGGVADFTTPRKETVELPPGTVFPTEHLRQVIEAAAAGSRFVSHQVFDGFGFDALTQVTSVIGAARPLEPGPVASEGGSGSAWPLNMAYYNVARNEQAPEFEATFLLDDKGILHDVGLDYGDFRLEASLEQLELLAPPDC